jgi:hypothetical protein
MVHTILEGSMGKRRLAPILTSISILFFSGPLIGQIDPASPHAECSYFGPNRTRFVEAALRGGKPQSQRVALSGLTGQVTGMRHFATAGPVQAVSGQPYPDDSIDAWIFADLRANSIAPALKTNDWEFIRRVSLDITGRIPSPERVLTFVADSAADKRTKLIEELLSKPEWVDKWAMYFGDLYQNAAARTSTNLNRAGTGRNVFAEWIRDSLAKNKPYDQMASELIGPPAGNSYINGAINWLVNGLITNGPNQDSIDQMTANVFETFLGMGHVNCLLCHNGRGHLDGLSLWASNTTRYEAWQLASFFSRSRTVQQSGLSFNLQDNVQGFNLDYTLNTVSGNRPVRQGPDGCGEGQPCRFVPPQYIFTGATPKPGENYRTALARSVTGDFQFARATVNYIWAQFFGRGIVDPVDGFDPARLDPDNPPPNPWTLQPSNARLLNSLARRFVDGGYNLKSLMREIAASDTYQLSSRYEGEWNPAWEPYFARKFVRRLWAEEIHNAVVQSSGSSPDYTAGGLQVNPRFAMAFPEPAGMPSNDTAARSFLDAFLRGNRDDLARRQDGSIIQALRLMNSPFVEARLKVEGPTPNQLIVQNLNKGNNDLVNTLFLAILSRYPSPGELSKAIASLSTDDADRLAAVQDLVWSLYNKVDFVFNY